MESGCAMLDSGRGNVATPVIPLRWQIGTVQHTIDIEQVALSQRGDLARRRLVLIDKNRDL